MVKIAALYHDLGYLNGPQNHEERSCQMLADEAEQWGLTQDDVLCCRDLIMATRMPQSPKTPLQRIMCDADLDYLGREDYEEIADRLKKEFMHFGLIGDDQKWNELQLRFLSEHQYWTESNRAARAEGKARNLEIIKARLKA